MLSTRCPDLWILRHRQTGWIAEGRKQGGQGIVWHVRDGVMTRLEA
jgi:hypothetical protein